MQPLNIPSLPHIDEALLDRFRGRGRCEYCHRQCRNREPHHIRQRGIGGWSRVDVPINLISLGSAMPGDCNCHGRFHVGHIPRCDLLALVAAREGVLQGEIEAEMDRILWRQGR
jgi:hypothetical protein